MNLIQSRFNKLNVKIPAFFAPMVGLSHVAFRELVRYYSPENITPHCFTEMLSTRRVPYESLTKTDSLKVAPGEIHFIPQLLGNEERFIKDSIERLKQIEPWGLDINMGCPAKHILKHNWGVRLFGDPGYAASVVEMARKYTTGPLSVKIRGGSGKTEEEYLYLLKFTKALEDAGADWITIHPREAKQKHKGNANWDLVSAVAQERNIPIVVNGGIQTSEQAVQLLQNTPIDGVMFARAATARPWIFWQLCEDLGYTKDKPKDFAGKMAPRTPQEEGLEYPKSVKKLIELLKIYFDERYILEKTRFYSATSARWFEHGHFFWKNTVKAKTVQDLENFVSEFIEKHEGRMDPTVRL